MSCFSATIDLLRQEGLRCGNCWFWKHGEGKCGQYPNLIKHDPGGVGTCHSRAMAIFSGRRGFSLIEILVVVIVFGVLVAIVIPQFSEPSLQQNEFDGSLHALRAAVAQYAKNHGGSLPDEPGQVLAGRYIAEIPANPHVHGSAARVIKRGEGRAPGDGSSGWWLDIRTGMVWPNHVRQ